MIITRGVGGGGGGGGGKLTLVDHEEQRLLDELDLVSAHRAALVDHGDDIHGSAGRGLVVGRLERGERPARLLAGRRVARQLRARRESDAVGRRLLGAIC